MAQAMLTGSLAAWLPLRLNMSSACLLPAPPAHPAATPSRPILQRLWATLAANRLNMVPILSYLIERGLKEDTMSGALGVVGATGKEVRALGRAGLRWFASVDCFCKAVMLASKTAHTGSALCKAGLHSPPRPPLAPHIPLSPALPLPQVVLYLSHVPRKQPCHSPTCAPPSVPSNRLPQVVLYLSRVAPKQTIGHLVYEALQQVEQPDPPESDEAWSPQAASTPDGTPRVSRTIGVGGG